MWKIGIYLRQRGLIGGLRMSDLLKRIADYFTNDYQGDDKTAPTMEITVDDLRYIANMNVEMCRAEAELRNLKYNKGKKDKGGGIDGKI